VSFRTKAILCVLFPVIVMAGWLAKLTWDRETGLRIELPIRGYDPRDLLSGHYLRYQVDYGENGKCPKDGERHTRDWREPYCFCAQADTAKPIYWSGYCADKPASCEYFIQGSCYYGDTIDAGIERFYISERLSHEGVTLGDKAKVQLSVPRSGRAIVRGITF